MILVHWTKLNFKVGTKLAHYRERYRPRVYFFGTGLTDPLGLEETLYKLRGAYQGKFLDLALEEYLEKDIPVLEKFNA